MEALGFFEYYNVDIPRNEHHMFWIKGTYILDEKLAGFHHMRNAGIRGEQDLSSPGAWMHCIHCPCLSQEAARGLLRGGIDSVVCKNTLEDEVWARQKPTATASAQ